MNTVKYICVSDELFVLSNIILRKKEEAKASYSCFFITSSHNVRAYQSHFVRACFYSCIVFCSGLFVGIFSSFICHHSAF